MALKGAKSLKDGRSNLEIGASEYFSGFDNIGHNSLPDLILLWIIPK